MLNLGLPRLGNSSKLHNVDKSSVLHVVFFSRNQAGDYEAADGTDSGRVFLVEFTGYERRFVDAPYTCDNADDNLVEASLTIIRVIGTFKFEFF